MAIKKAVIKESNVEALTEVKKTLKSKANENTTVVKKKGKDPEEVVKEGIPSDHAVKHQTNQSQNSSQKMAGINFGITKNMGQYESLRVDCWLVDEVQEGETQKEALVRLGDIVQEQVEYEVDRILGA